MFSSFTTKKLLTSTRQHLVNVPKRSYQFQSKQYFTGFERMLLDKFQWARFHGHWFAIFGALNLVAFGLHLYARPDNYKYYFGYTGQETRTTQVFKSLMGSENFLNVAWTAPTLIGLNYYLHKQLGALVMTKLFTISLVSSYFFMSTFNPTVKLNFRPLQGFIPKLDSFANDGSYFMGADSLALSLIYFTLLYHKLWIVALPLMAADLLYYGPAIGGAPAAAIVSALILV